jgi:hypothetical protein
LAAGDFDVVSGVADGFAEVHGGPGGGAPVEGGVAERGAHVVHHGGEVNNKLTEGTRSQPASIR